MMDKPFSGNDRDKPLGALEKAKEMQLRMEAQEEEKRWADIPVPLSLGKGLERLKKDNLSAIRSNLEIRGASSLKKQDLIGVLKERIPEALPSLLGKMDETRYKILERISDSRGYAYVPLETFQMDYFRDRGLLFTGTYKGRRVLVMPQELLESFGRINKASLRETIRRNTE